MLLKIIAYVLIAIGLYYFIISLFVLPSGKSIKMMNSIRNKKRSMNEKLNDRFVNPLIKLVSKFVIIENYKLDKLTKNLHKAGYNVSAEEYIAKCIVLAFYCFSCAIVFFILGIPIASLGCCILALSIYFKEIGRVGQIVKKMNNDILLELPSLVRTFMHSYEGTKDIIKIFEKYRKVAGPAFQYDLDVLISDLKTGNHEEALKKFEDRINISQLTTFTSAVIGTSKGIDQKTLFFIMEQEMKVLSKENQKREISKLPGKVRRATWAVVVCMILIYGVSLAITISDGLKIFK